MSRRNSITYLADIKAFKKKNTALRAKKPSFLDKREKLKDKSETPEAENLLAVSVYSEEAV